MPSSRDGDDPGSPNDDRVGHEGDDAVDDGPATGPATAGPRRSARAPRRTRDGLGSRAQRGADLARLSATTGAGYVSSRLRGLRDAEAEPEFHAETAERMLEMLGSMKGAAMKIGQIASFVDLDLPPEIAGAYQQTLGQLTDHAPAADPESIAGVVRDEYGARPEEVFADWEPEPLAAASIGQVHRAALPDGTQVVVKVQYPGVAEAIEADLSNAEAFAPMARVVSPNLEIRPLLEEMRERLIDELDYQREAQYQHAFAVRYDGHPFIRVPHVFSDWCRPRVLVTEYLEGRDFDTMLATSDDEEQRRYGEIIFRFVYGSLHRFRLFNADPHPGNYLFPTSGPEAGSVVFLDFGSVKLFRSQTRNTLTEALQAVSNGDADRLVTVLEDAGFIPPRARIDPQRVFDWFAIINAPVLADRQWTYTPEFAREVIRTTTDPRLGHIDMLRRLNLPADYLLLNRIQWGVNSILGRLRAHANWYRIMHEFWEGAPPETELGRAERPFIDASPYLA
ncbi:AarF/ABC1/UbiB kinase family protein [Egibacter rhizosphaerae]|uniref:AarF/ABC1/UbiB kinase family protein n=1 Tax=Egibacter rhizosphaerae TaxID=1670831 RepID=A0A411YAS1_9ACTN|nr:AarF/ABC1/UbiB kinase family protein [Egibacter rhizosphaerae]QBI18304.1 AarF/ABC1/UbiB kinase family protein [Egibacter rhizosphaerae]